MTTEAVVKQKTKRSTDAFKAARRIFDSLRKDKRRAYERSKPGYSKGWTEADVLAREETKAAKKKAKAAGEKFYQGRPHKCGGTTYTISGSCVACAKAYRESPEGRAAAKASRERPEDKASKKAYDKDYRKRPTVKAAAKARRQTPESKVSRKAFNKTYYDKTHPSSLLHLARRLARKKAKANGSKFFQGEPHEKCGGTTKRYTSRGKCVACVKAADKSRTRVK